MQKTGGNSLCSSDKWDVHTRLSFDLRPPSSACLQLHLKSLCRSSSQMKYRINKGLYIYKKSCILNPHMTCRVKPPPVILRPNQLHLLPPSLPLFFPSFTYSLTPAVTLSQKLHLLWSGLDLVILAGTFLFSPLLLILRPQCQIGGGRMLLGDDDRPTRDEKRVTALFLLGFFFNRKGGGGGRKQSLYV